MLQGASIFEFQKLYPDDEACMDLLFRIRHDGQLCPKCHRQTKFYRVKTRKCFECGNCGYQIYPLRGTTIEGSKVPLIKWIYTIYLMMQSKNAMSALELQRYIKVSYKIALKMTHKIRLLMDEDIGELYGVVEVDETYIGGKKRAKGESKVGFNGHENKCIVFGMRSHAGQIKAFVVKNTSAADLLPIIQKHAQKGSVIHSDEHAPYKRLPELGYRHYFITHKEFQWSKDGVTTNRIEGFWSYIKGSIRGTFKHVSKQWLENYLREYTFRNNNRNLSTDEQLNKLLRRLLNVSSEVSLPSLQIEP